MSSAPERTLPSRPLANTGLRVSEIGLGTSAFGGVRYGPASKQDSIACLEAYLSAGGRFIDTARGYGISEEVIGEVLDAHATRPGIVLASKSGGNNLKALESDLAASLRALRTDFLDIYYLHRAPRDPAHMQRALDAMTALKDDGRIRAIGMSVPSTEVDRGACEIARQYIETGSVDVIQLNFSVFRQGMREVFDAASRHRTGIVARGVLENGFLSGKYAPGRRFTDHRARWNGRRVDRLLERAKDLQRSVVAAPYRSLPDVAIRFALDESAIASVVIGARTAEQIAASLSVLQLPALSPATLALMRERYARHGRDFNLDRWWNRWARVPAKMLQRLR